MDMNRLWAESAGAIMILLSVDEASETEDCLQQQRLMPVARMDGLALQAQSMGLVSHTNVGDFIMKR